MAYATAKEFFDDAPRRVDPAKASGLRATYRFEVGGAGTWRAELDGGSVSIAERGGDAACVVRTDEATFLGIVNGETSPVSAFMLGKVRVEGDLSLLTGLRDFLVT